MDEARPVRTVAKSCWACATAATCGDDGSEVGVGDAAADLVDDLAPAELPADLREAMNKQTALGRFGDAAEVAATVAFLASDAAGYITGETINVNGGLYMA